MIIFLLLLWLILAFVIASTARSKGRSYGAFFLATIFLTPLTSLIILLVLGDNTSTLEEKAVIKGDSKVCPKCAETIKSEALVCRFCGNEFSEASITAIPEAQIKENHWITESSDTTENNAKEKEKKGTKSESTPLEKYRSKIIKSSLIVILITVSMVIYYDSSMFEETKPGLYITTEAYYNDVLNSLSPDDLKFIEGLDSKQEKMFYISYYDSKGATIHKNARYLVSDSEGRYQYRLENGKYVKSNTINKSSISVPLLSFDLDYKHGASAFSETYEDNENDLKEKQIEYNGQKVTSTDLIINSIDFSVKSAKGDYVTPSIDDIYKIIERSNNDQKKFFSIFIDVVKKANEHEAAIVDDEKHYFWFKTLLTTLLALFLLYKRCFISRPEEELAPKPTL